MGIDEHNRRATSRQGLTPPTAADRFKEQMLTIMNEYEQARRDEITAAGGDADEDRDPLEFVRDLADGYEQRRGDETALVRYLDQVARQLNPEDVRALRVAAEAVKKVTPLIIRIAADEDGMTPAQIAEDLGMTESYVYRILREHRANFEQ
ncbi:helix-turn-helix domain-containing protein [Streptomyces sp. NPDC092370]|uniref:helix-turn-helix domain-containing protein n=1 Tax=Streptomyces sp. NPDC092370 TaxID=3366016 RepID=UPI00380DC26A